MVGSPQQWAAAGNRGNWNARGGMGLIGRATTHECTWFGP